MRILEQTGMNPGWIYEAIVTSYTEDNPHSAPIGIWTHDFAVLHMDIYKKTKTIANILRWNEFAVNLVSDLEVFYQSLFDREKLAYEKSPGVNAPFIKGTPLVIELRVKKIEEQEHKFHLESVPVHIRCNGDVHLINRAKALALESLVLATKSPHLPELRMEETLRENYRIIKRVAPGSEYETILQKLFHRLQIGCE